jgi:hypothetical protein
MPIENYEVHGMESMDDDITKKTTRNDPSTEAFGKQIIA